MSFIFECPYCGEMFSESDDLEHIRSHKLCPGCQASFDDDDLDELLPDEDLPEEEDASLIEEDEGDQEGQDEDPPEGDFGDSDGDDGEDDDDDDDDENEEH